MCVDWDIEKLLKLAEQAPSPEESQKAAPLNDFERFAAEVGIKPGDTEIRPDKLWATFLKWTGTTPRTIGRKTFYRQAAWALHDCRQIIPNSGTYAYMLDPGPFDFSSEGVAAEQQLLQQQRDNIREIKTNLERAEDRRKREAKKEEFDRLDREWHKKRGLPWRGEEQ